MDSSPPSDLPEQGEPGTRKSKDKRAKYAWKTSAAPFVPSQQTAIECEANVNYYMQNQQTSHSFVGDESASWNQPPHQESSSAHNESMSVYQQHHQQFPRAVNQSMNYPDMTNNTLHHPGNNSGIIDQSTYGNTTQAQNNLLPMMQPLNFYGYNGNVQWTPGVFPMNPLNGHLPQSIQQGMIFPPPSGQVAVVPGSQTMSASPIIYGHVAPARQMHLPMSSLQQQQQSSQYPSQSSYPSTMNRTLPHQFTERDRSSHNQTFGEFNGNRREINKSPRTRQSNSSIRQRNSLEMFNRNSRQNHQEYRQPGNREKADKVCNINYRFNKNLVTTGSIIPTNVTQNCEGLNRIINGLTKDVVRLQQFVQVLVNDRDAEMATKAKLHQNSSTQTIARETKEKQVQVGSQDGISVDEPQKVNEPLEIPLLAQTAIQSEPTKELPTDVEKAGETVEALESSLKSCLISGKVSEMESSAPTIKPKETPESAKITEEISLVSKKLDEANVFAEKVSDLQPSTSTTSSSSLDDNVSVKTGYSENSETPILKNSSNVDPDDTPVFSSTISSIKEAPKKDLKPDETGADPRLPDEIGKIGSERSANTDEMGSVKMDSEEIDNIPEEKSVERQIKKGTVNLESFRRAEYADIAKLNLPVSPATRAQPMRQRAVNPTSSPNAQGTPNAHHQPQTLPNGFQFQKKSVSTPTLTEEQLRKALAARRLFDSPVLTLVQKTPKSTKTTPTKGSSHQNPRKSGKKGTPTPKKSSEKFGSPEDYKDFVSDEQKILDFTTTIKANLLDYAAKMKSFRVYFGSSPEGRPVMDTLLEKLMDYWQKNRSHIFDQKLLKQVQGNLKARLDSLEAKSDLSSRKLRVFIKTLFDTGDNLLSDDFFYMLLLPDKQQQLSFMSKYMELVTNYTDWSHLLNLPPNHPSTLQ
ncbi:hypothetical protein CAEBREN_25060 [Caenorhabditis brenneri]|uniref:Uncharacterized protein n=1 Tax=Caenorhabditis brenneri TaxID=135651 RepID=G0MY63_CAEBE|nr:hypothetical protein CAEBREN_25060 [Caenorhabditis brenneri]